MSCGEQLAASVGDAPTSEAEGASSVALQSPPEPAGNVADHADPEPPSPPDAGEATRVEPEAESKSGTETEVGTETDAESSAEGPAGELDQSQEPNPWLAGETEALSQSPPAGEAGPESAFAPPVEPPPPPGADPQVVGTPPVPPPLPAVEDGPIAPGAAVAEPLPPPPTQTEAWSAPPSPDALPQSLLLGTVADRSEPGMTEPVAPPPPPSPTMALGPADPHGLEAHLARLNAATRPHAEIPALIAGALLTASETVSVVVPGLIGDDVGVAVVTERRVLLVNGRRWNPVVIEVPFRAGLTVEGWQDETTAMLTFISEERVRITAIVDKPLAFEAARLVRERVAAPAPRPRASSDEIQW